MTALTLDIQRMDDAHSAPADGQFESWIQAALEGAEFLQDDAEVSLAIVSADEIAALNHQYRHKNYPTNVLSFPAELPEGIDVPLLGDIIICSEVVEKEAAEQEKPIESHWAHMTVHGILHLLGFDHIIEHEAEEMESLETRILNGLGYNNPYEAQLP